MNNVLKVAIPAGVVLLSSGVAMATPASPVDLSTSVTAASDGAKGLVLAYGAGIIGIALVPKAFNWLKNKVMGAIR